MLAAARLSLQQLALYLVEQELVAQDEEKPPDKALEAVENLLRQWGRVAPTGVGAKSRYFPADWPLLRGIVVKLLTEKESGVRPAQAVAFLQCLDLPFDEVRPLLDELERAHLSPERLREVERELAQHFPALYGWVMLMPDEAEQRRAHAFMLAMPTDQVPEAAQPLPKHSSSLLSENPLFVGRARELRELAMLLKSRAGLVAITGPGGVGKTQLAAEFARRYGQHFVGGVFWISFAEPYAVRSRVIESGFFLGAEFLRLDPDDQERLVRRYWANPLPKLLIFDNCEDEHVLQHWRPDGASCRVLVTSRYAGWGPALGVVARPLAPLPVAAGVQLLCSFRADLRDDATLPGVVERLGGLPLALHLAGAFLGQCGEAYHPADYLAELEAQPLVSHMSLQGDEAGASPTGHEHHLGRTFELSYRLLRADEEATALSRALLNRAACFAPAIAIPHELLRATVAQDLPRHALPRALTRLVHLSLIGESSKGLLLHPLIADYIRAESHDRAARSAVEAVLFARAAEANDAQDLPALRALQAHLSVVTAAADAQGEAAPRLSFELGRLLHNLGEYQPAELAYMRVLALLEAPGDPSALWVRARRALATLRIDQGRGVEALEMLGAVLAFDRRTHGDESALVAWDLNLFGEAHREAGDYVAALPWYQEALAILGRQPEPDTRWTATIKNNYAVLQHVSGAIHAARVIYEEVLPLYSAECGSHHTETLKIEQNIGEVLYEEGAYEQAALRLAALLPISEEVRGRAHPETAMLIYMLARCRAALGDSEGARSLFQRVLATLDVVFGPQHTLTVQARAALTSLDAGQAG